MRFLEQRFVFGYSYENNIGHLEESLLMMFKADRSVTEKFELIMLMHPIISNE